MIKRLLYFFTVTIASCDMVAYANTPPQVINKQCSANQFFSQIQPGPGNIQCTQPTYSGIANTPSFIDSLNIISNNVSLVNDSATPGNSKYYGTNSGGTRGFFSVPVIGLGTANGLSISSQLLSLGLSSTSTTGALSSTDWNTFNNKQGTITVGNFIDVGTDGIVVTGGTGAVIGAGTSIAQHVSDTTHNGYLSSIDWNTFNAKAPSFSTGNLSEATSAVLTITGGTGAVIGSGSSIQVLQSGSSQSGYLSSADWNAFNGKQDAGNYITALSSDVVASGPGSAAATIQSNVVSNSKLAQMPTNTIKGNNTALTANAVDLTTTQVNTLLGTITSLTGDATASGPGAAALTLATVNSNVGSFGDAATSVAFTVNAKGLVTAASSSSIQIAESQVTNLVSDLAGKQPTGNYITALTGDGTASGPGSAAFTLATVNSNTGAFGDASHSVSVTLNGKGLVTAASSNSIQIAESQVTNLVSDLAGKQATGNYITALTGDVTAAGPGSAASTLASTISGAKTFSTSLTSPAFISSTTSPATAGAVRLANADAIEFRNSTNAGNILLAPGSTDSILSYAGIDIANISSSQTLSSKTLSNPTVTGVMLNASGTAANPSYSFTGNGNTGMYNASGLLHFSTNGVSAAVVDASQNWIFTGTVAASNLSGTNTGDVTIGTANGLSLSGQALSLAAASGSVTGALTSTDWTTFNNKQAAGNYITALTGDVTASGPGSSAATLASSISGAKTFTTSITSPAHISSTANPASTGVVRLANADAIKFRNSGNSADISLTPGSTDNFISYAGIDLVNLSTAQTLTNKTLTSPVIGTIVNTGTLTLPTSTDTLVGKATTDILTNKTLTTPVIASITGMTTFTASADRITFTGNTGNDTTFQLATLANKNAISYARINSGSTTGAAYFEVQQDTGTKWSMGMDLVSTSSALAFASTDGFGTASAIHFQISTGGAVTIGAASTTHQHSINTNTATSATAGANGAVPAQVAGYVVITVNGTTQKIPYFNN